MCRLGGGGDLITFLSIYMHFNTINLNFNEKKRIAYSYTLCLYYYKSQG